MNTLQALFGVVNIVLQLVVWILLAQIILSWLIAFNVISMRNQTVRQISHGLDRLTYPLLSPIRRVLPEMGGLDFSPMVLLLLIWFIRQGPLEDLQRFVMTAAQ